MWRFFSSGDLELVHSFLMMPLPQARHLVLLALKRRLKRHRGQMALIRPKHIARELGLAAHPALLTLIKSILEELDVIEVDGSRWVRGPRRSYKSHGCGYYFLRAQPRAVEVMADV